MTCKIIIQEYSNKDKNFKANHNRYARTSLPC